MFRRKRRYADEIHNWDIPTDGIYLGQIVKNNKRFLFNEQELTKHTIIAGSTGSGKSVAAQSHPTLYSTILNIILESLSL